MHAARASALVPRIATTPRTASSSDLSVQQRAVMTIAKVHVTLWRAAMDHVLWHRDVDIDAAMISESTPMWLTWCVLLGYVDDKTCVCLAP